MSDRIESTGEMIYELPDREARALITERIISIILMKYGITPGNMESMGYHAIIRTTPNGKSDLTLYKMVQSFDLPEHTTPPGTEVTVSYESD